MHDAALSAEGGRVKELAGVLLCLGFLAAGMYGEHYGIGGAWWLIFVAFIVFAALMDGI